MTRTEPYLKLDWEKSPSKHTWCSVELSPERAAGRRLSPQLAVSQRLLSVPCHGASPTGQRSHPAVPAERQQGVSWQAGSHPLMGCNDGGDISSLCHSVLSRSKPQVLPTLPGRALQGLRRAGHRAPQGPFRSLPDAESNHLLPSGDSEATTMME